MYSAIGRHSHWNIVARLPARLGRDGLKLALCIGGIVLAALASIAMAVLIAETMLRWLA